LGCPLPILLLEQHGVGGVVRADFVLRAQSGPGRPPAQTTETPHELQTS
jgi:hypothetical protein